MVPYLIPPGHNDGLLDRIEIEHCGFDLPQLNTVSPDFHLKVFAAQVREAAIGCHKAEIAGAVDPCVASLRVRQEGGTGRVRLAPIAQGEIVTPHRDLTDLVEPNFLSVIVEQQNLHVLDRVTNRDNVTGDLTSVIDEVPPDGAGLCRR